MFPFGGLSTIADYISVGMWSEKSINNWALTHNREYLSKLFHLFNVASTILYFGSIYFCSIIPLFYKMKNEEKYSIGIISGLICISIIIIGNIIKLL